MTREHDERIKSEASQLSLELSGSRKVGQLAETNPIGCSQRRVGLDESFSESHPHFGGQSFGSLPITERAHLYGMRGSV
jgi:hypothetical protein